MVESPQNRSAQLLKRRVVKQERDLLAGALEWASDDPAFERIAGTIVAARRRFVLGAAKSFTFASLFAMELSAGVANVTLIDGTIVRPIDVLSDVRSADVLVAISLARYRRYTIDVAEPFQRAGGRLVVITDSRDAPLVSVADESLILDTEAAQSPTVVATVIHILTTLTLASAKGAGRRMLEQDRLGEQLGLYLEE